MLVALALLLVATAWIAGALRADADLLPFVREAVPEARHIVKQDDRLFAAWADRGGAELLGYVAIGEAGGYSGPLRVAVAVDPSGRVIRVVVADHKETWAWMSRVRESGLLGSLSGKGYSDPWTIGVDVDGVTGATYTSKAVAEAVLFGGRAAARRLELPLEPLDPPKIVFGAPETVLLLLFAVGYLGHRSAFGFAWQARWVAMLVGMIVLGFIYNSPVTLAWVTRLVLGYWPQWQTNLYWYFLIGGILLVFTVDNKNPYCRWFCPFGAAQECMGVIGGARSRGRRRFSIALRWLPRSLALAAVLLGVFYRSPGLASYELFGTPFDLVGSNLPFVALGLVLVAALFINRPWCKYLCPITPVVDLIRVVRELVKELWRSITRKQGAA